MGLSFRITTRHRRSCSAGPWVAAVIVVLLCAVAAAPAAAVPAAQRAALIEIYNATGGPTWTNSAGWLSAEGTECTWHGVKCFGADTVFGLELHDNNLAGAFPEDLSGLADLNYLFAWDNSITGFGGLAGLPAVEYLYLSGNQLTELPEALNPTLVDLELYDNQISGPMPDFTGLEHLDYVDLSNNPWDAGPIPDWSHLPLRSIHLDDTNRTGPIPGWLGDRPRRAVQISRNPFDPGPVPEFLAQPSLENLGLTTTNRTGQIPDWIGGLTNLVVLRLTDNPFTAGPLPDLSQLKKLFLVSIQQANRTGPLPEWIGELTSLAVVYLGENSLSGSIPTSLRNLSEVQILCLHSNQMTGSLPFEIADTPKLAFVDLRWNGLQTGDPAIAGYFNGVASDCITGTFPVPMEQDFRDTQTTMPRFGLGVAGQTSTSLEVFWDPIRYSKDAGYYTVMISESSDGPFRLGTRVGPKTASSAVIDGLQPDTTYYFRLRAVTHAHPNNSNQVLSLIGPVFEGKTQP